MLALGLPHASWLPAPADSNGVDTDGGGDWPRARDVTAAYRPMPGRLRWRVSAYHLSLARAGCRDSVSVVFSRGARRSLPASRRSDLRGPAKSRSVRSLFTSVAVPRRRRTGLYLSMFERTVLQFSPGEFEILFEFGLPYLC